ncbi:hypothetical protein DYB37_012795 [Aphanomyces astaci]|uniref:Uncharacterized protein n=1 Tax=Aphanomyces astaci TaxID=112090 RepID=A0A418F7W8_APHAT|nr:hypothetical protein DYB37_012795 [Aphanomyces astaci]
MEDPSSGNEHAMNVELPGSDHKEEREDRSRSDRSASPTSGSAFQGRLQDRRRPRSQETVRRLFRSPQRRQQQVAVDESCTYGRPTGPAPASTAPTDDPTAEMEDVEMGQTDVYLHNAPALPKHPTFKGSTKEECRTFMAAYNLYISQTTALTVNGTKPFVMPKLDGLAAAIRRDRQEWVIKEESPAFVKIITDAVKPMSLHRAVTEQMALTHIKPLKKDVYRFVPWLREYAIGRERFVGYEEDTKPAAKPDPPKTNEGVTHGLLCFGSLEFKTGCGPLMLRGLRVWVDEAVVGVELTLGLPVMQKLGYSDKTLLENARRQQAEWDFADRDAR